MTADPYAPATLARLTRDARAVVASVRGTYGLEPDDLISAGWLAYVAAAANGQPHTACCTRARYGMVDALREWIGTPKDKSVTVLPLPPTLTAAPPSRATRTRLPRAVRRALATLSERERTALHLWTVRGWSHPLIAEALGIPEGTSGRVRHAALAKVRAAVGVASDIRRAPISARVRREPPAHGSASPAHIERAA